MNRRSHPAVWSTKMYDRTARHYDAMMRHLFPVGEKGREVVADELIAGSVLDVACGTGTLLEMAYQKGLDCYGIDLSEGMLGQAAKKVPRAKLVRASYYAIPYADGTFDYVVATNALSGRHIDAREALREMHRVCKSGGHIYIAEWPRPEQETLGDRLIEWIAALNDDAPKNYRSIFEELGYTPQIRVLSRRYQLYGVKK